MNFSARPGVTLVELLVYMTILSLVTIGVTQMVTEIQKSNVNAVNLADQFAESDLTMRRVQVRLGNSDDVEVVDLKPGSGDNACLRLKAYTQYVRKGIRFNGRNQRIQGSSSNEIPIVGASPRTMSAWIRIDPDNIGLSTVAMWGNGIGKEFGIDVREGAPEVRFGCLTLRPQHEVYSEGGLTLTRPLNFRDGGWHHIAVTFEDAGNAELSTTSAKLFIDGRQVPTEVPNCESTASRTISTWRTTLYIGRQVHDKQSTFKGLISDLRIWDRALYPSEITALAQRDPSANANTAGLLVSMPLDDFDGRGLANSGSWPGGAAMQAVNMGEIDLVQSTLVDQTRYHSFCMIDDDGDGLHELWESATAMNVPDRVGGDAYQARSRTWDKNSEDMFVPSPNGFFKVIGRDPESVIANFAVGKGIGDAANLRQKAQSKPLATTRSKTQPELCTIDTRPLTIPRTCQNSFKEAYVGIEDYIKGLHGKLDLLNVTWADSGDFQYATNLPNMPGTVTATWYPQYGILKFASTVPIEDKYWQRAMAMTLYRPSGRSSDANVTFNFGVGGLPYFKDGKYRFFRFVDNDGSGDQGVSSSNTAPTDPDANRQPDPDANRQPDPDANRQPDPDANRQPDPDANRQPDPDANRQLDPDANRQPDPDANRQGGVVNAVTFDLAVQLAHRRSDSCGLDSHLATITTEDEFNHLEQAMMVRSVPGWQSGWIGAKVEQSGTFSWVTGPADERKPFWFGTGLQGLPYVRSTDPTVIQRGDYAGRTLFEYDPLPHFGGNRKRSLVQPRRNNESFWFTNWAAGKESPSGYECDPASNNAPPGGCQPATARFHDGVAIYGHQSRNGTWFSVPNETQRCDATREHSICGYYVEFTEPGGGTNEICPSDHA